MSISMCMVALGPGAKLSASALQKDLRETWPSLGEMSKPEKGNGTLSFTLGSASVILGMMPAPIPWSELEGPCATSWLWRDAATEMRKHKGHVIVTVMQEGEVLPRVKLLTQVAASLAHTCAGALGVYYGDATLVVSPELFYQFAAEMLPDGYPLPIWVDLRVGPGDDGKMCGFTTGLAALGHMEMETLNSPDQPGELRERFLELAAYLLENGPVIQDGNTVGRDANERIHVTHTDSAFGHEGQVMRLDWEPTKKRKSWFGRG